jgi:hypothetical protein
MLNATAEQFLWRLFWLGLLEGDSKGADEWVASFYDKDIELPGRLETLLIEYWASRDRAVLLSLAKAALEDCSLDAAHRTELTAHLFVDGQIDVMQAYSFLGFEGVNVDDLRPSMRRVADVYWLLKQDSMGGVMEPGDDSLLSEALHTLARETHS